MKEREAAEDEYARKQAESLREKEGDSAVQAATEVKQWSPDDRLANISLRLCNLDLRGQDLSNLDFSGFQVHNIDFSKAKLDGAVFDGLQGTYEDMKFESASLRGARFVGVDLIHSNFDGADLTDGQILMSDMRNASMRGRTLRMHI